VRAEHNIEDAYETELVAYWSRWKQFSCAGDVRSNSSDISEENTYGGDDDENQEEHTAAVVIPEVEAAMRELSKKMDRGFRAWGLWARETLGQQQQQAKEEVAAVSERLEEAKKQFIAAQADVEGIAERRKAAEIRWVDVVVQERENMLREGEERELDGDGEGGHQGEDLEVLLAESQDLGVELTEADDIGVAA
jgi:hypothetical protein